LGNRPLRERGARGRQVGPPGGYDAGVLERERQVVRPLRMALGVRVEIGDDLARRSLEAGVPRSAQAAVLEGEDAEGEAAGDLEGTVGRSVVAEEDVEIRGVAARERLEAAADQGLR